MADKQLPPASHLRVVLFIVKGGISRYAVCLDVNRPIQTYVSHGQVLLDGVPAKEDLFFSPQAAKNHFVDLGHTVRIDLRGEDITFR